MPRYGLSDPAEARDTTDQTLENQNEEELGALHGKIKALRSVTIDIMDDSNRQNDQLDRTTNTFSSFTNSLFSTRQHHSRSMAANSTMRQYRTIFYCVGAMIVLWLLLKIWRGIGGGHSAAPEVEI